MLPAIDDAERFVVLSYLGDVYIVTFYGDDQYAWPSFKPLSLTQNDILDIKEVFYSHKMAYSEKLNMLAVPVLYDNKEFKIRIYDLDRKWLKSELFVDIDFDYDQKAKDVTEEVFIGSLEFVDNYLVYHTDLLSADEKDRLQVVEIHKHDIKVKI